MKYLFFIMPAHGHMNPTFTVTEELVRRGEEVVYYTTNEFAEAAQKAGAEVRIIDPKFNPLHYFKHLNLSEAHIFKKSSPHLMVQFMREIRQKAHELIGQVKAEKTDVAVYDPMCTWGKEIIQTLRLPSATFYSSFPFKKESSSFKRFVSYQGMNEAEELLELFTVTEELNIVSIPKEFQFEGELFDDRYAFVGPLISDRKVNLNLPLKQLESQSILYISLGSILSNINFYKTCFEAFSNTSWQVVLNIGPRTNQAELGPIPNNFLIRSFVPQLEVLKHTDVFITHGGMNSVMEALWYGVPTIAIPQSSDQPLVAERLKELGLGKALHSDQITADILREVVETMKHDAKIQKRLNEMSQSMKGLDAIHQTANLLQSFTNERKFL